MESSPWDEVAHDESIIILLQGFLQDTGYEAYYYYPNSFTFSLGELMIVVFFDD